MVPPTHASKPPEPDLGWAPSLMQQHWKPDAYGGWLPRSGRRLGWRLATKVRPAAGPAAGYQVRPAAGYQGLREQEKDKQEEHRTIRPGRLLLRSHDGADAIVRTRHVAPQMARLLLSLLLLFLLSLLVLWLVVLWLWLWLWLVLVLVLCWRCCCCRCCCGVCYCVFVVVGCCCGRRGCCWLCSWCYTMLFVIMTGDGWCRCYGASFVGLLFLSCHCHYPFHCVGVVVGVVVFCW